MNVKEALAEIGKYTPCPHDCIDTRLGNGQVWAQCEDCGETIKQESLERLRLAHERFMDALGTIQDTTDGLGFYPPVLDVCCGSRMFWFNRTDARAFYIDKRRETHAIDKGTPGTKGRKPIEVNPDMQADFTDLPFPDGTFRLVVFDPPHIQREEAKGILTKKYGHLKDDWRQMLSDGFAECFRVLMPGGVLIFKWAESEVVVSEILKLTPEKPLFGHKSGKAATTHWVTFIKSA